MRTGHDPHDMSHVNTCQRHGFIIVISTIVQPGGHPSSNSQRAPYRFKSYSALLNSTSLGRLQITTTGSRHVWRECVAQGNVLRSLRCPWRTMQPRWPCHRRLRRPPWCSVLHFRPCPELRKRSQRLCPLRSRMCCQPGRRPFQRSSWLRQLRLSSACRPTGVRKTRMTRLI